MRILKSPLDLSNPRSFKLCKECSLPSVPKRIAVESFSDSSWKNESRQGKIKEFSSRLSNDLSDEGTERHGSGITGLLCKAHPHPRSNIYCAVTLFGTSHIRQMERSCRTQKPRSTISSVRRSIVCYYLFKVMQVPLVRTKLMGG